MAPTTRTEAKSLEELSAALGGEKEKRSNLGRGLAALFGEAESKPAESEPQRAAKRMPLEHLHPNRYQPRRHFDKEALGQLADSIRENGVLQPILVRPHAEKAGEFEIVAGERRWRAAQIARVHDIPVMVRDLSDAQALEIAVLENVQREDLTPLEEADGYRRLMEEFSYTQEKVAQTLGKSRSHIANALRLLTLPAAVKSLLEAGEISAGHARALVSVDAAESLAKEIVSAGLSVRQTEKLIQDRRGAAGRVKGARSGGRRKSVSEPNAATPDKDADTLALERELSAMLGLEVAITMLGAGEDDERGMLTINYDTLDQLDDVLRRLNISPEDAAVAESPLPVNF
ncbi:MAG TPA: ParB/RepB/Spo0J family partition protein [Kiloniellaceae bacterium]|nr:ParB/RepB/Spo0J family partition protein [Kiloniellaceae bacterium]